MSHMEEEPGVSKRGVIVFLFIVMCLWFADDARTGMEWILNYNPVPAAEQVHLAPVHAAPTDSPRPEIHVLQELDGYYATSASMAVMTQIYTRQRDDGDE